MDNHRLFKISKLINRPIKMYCIKNMFHVSLDRVELKTSSDSGILSGYSSTAETIEDAFDIYVENISGQILVIDAGLESRKEYIVI
jgi:hypothetical protein